MTSIARFWHWTIFLDKHNVIYVISNNTHLLCKRNNHCIAINSCLTGLDSVDLLTIEIYNRWTCSVGSNPGKQEVAVGTVIRAQRGKYSLDDMFRMSKWSMWNYLTSYESTPFVNEAVVNIKIDRSPVKAFYG